MDGHVGKEPLLVGNGGARLMAGEEDAETHYGAGRERDLSVAADSLFLSFEDIVYEVDAPTEGGGGGGIMGMLGLGAATESFGGAGDGAEEREAMQRVSVGSQSAGNSAADMAGAGASPASSKNKIRILDRVSGYTHSGEVFCILGPSGSGKTCLMHTLAQRGLHGDISGTLLLNGRRIPQPFHASAFVCADDDSLYPTLTVYESLLFSAQLRLAHELSEPEMQSRVRDTIAELDLVKVTNTRIGYVGGGGLSTGQRRRAAIGVELVAGKNVLFLDEPTSGLDASTALTVVNIMSRLARRNRMIITVLHQPRAQIYDQLDRILLLSPVGTPVFFGAASAAAQYFAGHDYHPPPRETMADFMLDVALKLTPQELRAFHQEVAETTKPGISDGLHAIDLASTLMNGAENGSAAGATNGGGGRDTQAYNGNGHDHAAAADIPAHRLQEPAPPEKTERSWLQEQLIKFDLLPDPSADMPRAAYGYQLWKCTQRALQNRYRNRVLIVSIYSTAIFIGILGYVFYPDMKYSYADFQNRVALLTMLPYATSLFCTTGFEVQKHDRHVFQLERSNGYYHPTAFLFGISLADVVQLRIFPPILTGLICYFPCNLQDHASNFFIFMIVLVLMNVVGAGLCRVVGSMINDNGTATLVSSAIILLMLLYCGFLVNPSAIPRSMKWFRDCSYFYWGCGVLYFNEIDDITFTLATIDTEEVYKAINSSLGNSSHGIETTVNVVDIPGYCNRSDPLTSEHCRQCNSSDPFLLVGQCSYTIETDPEDALNQICDISDKCSVPDGEPDDFQDVDLDVTGDLLLDALSLTEIPNGKGIGILAAMVGIYFTLASLIALFFHKAVR